LNLFRLQEVSEAQKRSAVSVNCESQLESLRVSDWLVCEFVLE